VYSYISLQELRNGLDIRQKDSADEQLIRIGVSVSKAIDRLCGRTFRTYENTRIYSPHYTDYVKIDDLLEVDSVKTDLDYDGVYEITWATTDYRLEEVNAPLDEKPYTSIWIKTGGAQYFPQQYENSLEIVGKWGYWESLELSTATVSASASSSATSIIVTAVNDIDVGNTILIGTEQLYVAGRDESTNTLTVVRAVNSTTAAAISAAATIQIYRYPEPVMSATQMLVNRYHARIKTPLGMVNVPGDIGWRAIYIPKRDMDVIEMIRHYMTGAFFA
jgi:hypothetical protein